MLFAGRALIRARASARKRRARGMFARFYEDRGGNIAILFTFLVGLLMLFTGAAVDYTRYNAVRADLMESMDAAGLAMAQIDALNGPDISSLTGTARDSYLKDQGKKFFYENFKHASLVQNLSIDFDITPATITPKASGSIKTLFLHIGENLLNNLNGTSTHALDSLNLTTDTEITRKGAGKIEVALVLDQTGSMAQKASSYDTYTKIESLDTAVDNLLNVFFGTGTTSSNVKIGVVPFNAFVNPGGASSWQSSWGDQSANAYYNGAHFIHVDKAATVDTSSDATDYDPNGVAELIDPDKKVNHYDLYNSSSSLTWAGCVEARPYPLDELDTVPGSTVTSSTITDAISVPSALASPSTTYETREKTAFEAAPATILTTSELASSDNSRWVPMFQPDGPDCRYDSNCQYGDNQITATYTLGSTSRTATGYQYWFVDPDSGNGISESAYDNPTLIRDKNFTLSSGGEKFARYLDVVEDFQFVADKTFTTGSYWDKVKNELSGVGAIHSSSALDQCGWVTYTTGRGRNKQTHTEWRCTTYITYGDEYALRQAYVGWWDPSLGRYTGKYDQSPSVNKDYNTGQETQGPNKDCPVKILPLTNDRSKVEAEMDLIKPYGNTNSANGMIWGMRVLSPEAPFTEGASYSSGDWTKAIVLMTDGENTVAGGSTHWGSDLSAYGYASESRLGVGMNNTTDMRNQYDEKLLRICYRAKEKGILVYSIIFGLDSSSLETVFKACATKPVAPYYYKAPSAADLESAFSDIAQDLVKLHVSK